VEEREGREKEVKGYEKGERVEQKVRDKARE